MSTPPLRMARPSKKNVPWENTGIHCRCLDNRDDDFARMHSVPAQVVSLCLPPYGPTKPSDILARPLYLQPESRDLSLSWLRCQQGNT